MKRRVFLGGAWQSPDGVVAAIPPARLRRLPRVVCVLCFLAPDRRFLW
jgi:hypothetical protein